MVDKSALIDVQSQADERNIIIQRAGIRGLRYPVTIHLNDENKLCTVAVFDIASMLPADQRGVHMSRFVELLERWKHTISWAAMPDITDELLQTTQGSNMASFSCTFAYFRSKEAPVTKLKSTMDYDCTFHCTQGTTGTQQYIKLSVPVMTLCPCSKALSKQGAHNQRAVCTITLHGNREPDIERIIDNVEAAASSALYTLLKRSDEQAVTENSYANPTFVEDLLRNIVLSVRQDYQCYTLDVVSEESIHNHNAYAYTVSGGQHG